MFDEYQLLDDDIVVFPIIVDGDSYGDTQAFLLCNSLNAAAGGNWYLWAAASLPPDNTGTYTYGQDVCEDLGIDSGRYCTSMENLIRETPFQIPNCTEPTVIEAIVNASLKPQSFINRPGFKLTDKILKNNNDPSILAQTLQGGLLLPRLEPDVLLDLAKLGITINHLAHGKSNISS